MDFLIIIGEFILVMFETETVSAEQSQSAIAIDHFLTFEERFLTKQMNVCHYLSEIMISMLLRLSDPDPQVAKST